MTPTPSYCSTPPACSVGALECVTMLGSWVRIRPPTVCAVAALAAVSICLVGCSAEAQTTRGAPSYRQCDDTERRTTLRDLAVYAAPVLWFSADEPFLDFHDFSYGGLPHNLPSSDGSAQATARQRSGTVYFKAIHARSRFGTSSIPERMLRKMRGVPESPLPLRALSALTLRYFAYYDEDVEHEYDLEVVDVRMLIKDAAHQPPGTVCSVVEIVQIAGAAHGADWYTSVLDVDDVTDVVWPPHVLVEEGKHASAPDRNADGWFTPGYDATRQVADAWGVRDAYRNKRTSAFAYDASLAKDRCSAPRVAVEQLGFGFYLSASNVLPAFEQISRCFEAFSAEQRRRMVWPYRLIEAGTGGSAEYCERGAVAEGLSVADDLQGYLRRWEFCAHTAIQGKTSVAEEWLERWFVRPTRFASTAGRLRWLWKGSIGYLVGWERAANAEGELELSAHGHDLVWMPAFAYEVDWVGGWVVPRLSFGKRVGADLLYTRSASRAVDWYASIGRKWGGWGREAQGVEEEVGVRLRFPMPKQRSRLARVGIGLRGPMHRGGGVRLITEFGIGGW